MHDDYSNHQKLFLENEQLQNDYDKLKKDERDKEVKLRDLHIKFDRREQARQDLKVWTTLRLVSAGFTAAKKCRRKAWKNVETVLKNG